MTNVQGVGEQQECGNVRVQECGLLLFIQACRLVECSGKTRVHRGECSLLEYWLARGQTRLKTRAKQYRTLKP